MALTKIDDRGLKTPIDLLDNEKIRLGTGNDLDLYHTSGVNYIQTHNNSNLEIKHGSDVSIKCTADGSVELYRDGAKKFETTNSGVAITGVLSSNQTSGQAISIGDNAQINLGTGDDLKLWHQTGNSYITSTGANLTLRAAGHLYLQDIDGNTMADFNDGAACEFYFDGTRKMETFASGVQLDDNLVIKDDKKLFVGDGYDLQLSHNGSNSNSYIKNTGTGELIIESTAGGVRFNSSSNATGLLFNPNTSIELYYDNSKKFETTSEGIETQGELHFKAPNSTTGEQVGRLEWWNENDAGVMAKIGVDRTGGQYAPADLVFSTNANVDTAANGSDGDITERLRITSAGLIGINESSPVNLLTISNANQQTDSVGNLQIRYTGSDGAYNSGLTVKNYKGTSQFMQWGDGGVRIGSRVLTNSGAGNIYFTTGSDSVKATLLASNGNLELGGGGNLVVNNGQGISFAATSQASGVTSELLDDYEEGSWTPSLTQTAGVTLTTYQAIYTKIGRMVHAYASVYWSGTPSSPSTNFRIGGLPYTAKSGNTFGNNSILYMDTFDFTGMSALVAQGNTYIYFHVNGGSGSQANNGHMQPNSSTRYILFGTSYMT